MIDLRLLQHALALARHRNYARAAEMLDMSQPALSRSIAGLEKALGVRLFDRTRQGVAPTAYGERLLARGAALLVDAAELERELALMQGLEIGALRIGAGPYPADMCVGPAVGRLAAKHPHLRIEVNTGDWREIIRQVLQAQLDLAVIELSAAEQDPRLVTEPLPKHAGTFFCRSGHPLLAEAVPTLERMFQFPFACAKMPSRAAQMFYRLAKSGAIDPDTGDYLPPIRVDTIALARAVVLSSDAVGLAALSLVAADVAAGRVVLLPFRQPWLHTNYGFAYLKDRLLSPAAQALMAEVKAVEAERVEMERKLEPEPPRSAIPPAARPSRAGVQR